MNLLQELEFQRWYKNMAAILGINPNPDDPRHFYDYRAAFQSGVRGPDATGHWPSEFKLEGHPRTVIGGVDTRTGRTSQQGSMLPGILSYFADKEK